MSQSSTPLAHPYRAGEHRRELRPCGDWDVPLVVAIVGLLTVIAFRWSGGAVHGPEALAWMGVVWSLRELLAVARDRR